MADNPLRRKWIVQAYDAFDGQPVLEEMDYDSFLKHWSRRAAWRQVGVLQEITDEILMGTHWRIIWQVNAR